MDDMRAFERQVAGELVRRAGPVRPIDAAAILAASTATGSRRWKVVPHLGPVRPVRAAAMSTASATTHAPQWRTQSMFSPTKFLLAGAIVALLGGFLVAGALSPSSTTDTPLGAELSAPPSLRENEFTGHLSIWGGLTSDTPGVIRYDYHADEMTDPRLEGKWVLDYTQSYVDFGGISKYLYHASFRMENEEGAWQEVPNLTLELPDGTATSRTSALVGEGAYQGLTAVTELTYIPQGAFDIHGVITDVPIPVAP